MVVRKSFLLSSILLVIFFISFFVIKEMGKQTNEKIDKMIGVEKTEYCLATPADTSMVYVDIENFFSVVSIDKNGWKIFKEKKNDKNFIAAKDSACAIYVKTGIQIKPIKLDFSGKEVQYTKNQKIALSNGGNHLYVAVVKK